MLTSFCAIRRAVRRVLARRLRLPEIPVALRRLHDNGFMPTLVADVGAYHGEFASECLNIWPECRVICFEAQASAVAHLRAVAVAHPQMCIVTSLVGAADRDEVVLHVAETASSILSEHLPGNFPREIHSMVALDDVEELRAKASLDLLKVDVQGYELEVLRGAEDLLRQTRVVLLELNLLDLYQDVPLMPEIIVWLRERGFVPYDICGLTRRPLDDALWQADMIFVPVDSPFRSDKRWGAV